MVCNLSVLFIVRIKMRKRDDVIYMPIRSIVVPLHFFGELRLQMFFKL